MAEGNGSAAKVVIAVLVIILSVGWLVYRYRPGRDRMVSRTQNEKEYVYVCGSGHTFRALGRKSPRPCTVPGCKEEAYLFILFSCPKGDRVGVLIKTNPKPMGDEYRFNDPSHVSWKPFNIDEITKEPCPKCYTPGLRPAPEEPG